MHEFFGGKKHEKEGEEEEGKKGAKGEEEEGKKGKGEEEEGKKGKGEEEEGKKGGKGEEEEGKKGDKKKGGEEEDDCDDEEGKKGGEEEEKGGKKKHCSKKSYKKRKFSAKTTANTPTNSWDYNNYVKTYDDIKTDKLKQLRKIPGKYDLKTWWKFPIVPVSDKKQLYLR